MLIGRGSMKANKWQWRHDENEDNTFIWANGERADTISSLETHTPYEEEENSTPQFQQVDAMHHTEEVVPHLDEQIEQDMIYDVQHLITEDTIKHLQKIGRAHV